MTTVIPLIRKILIFSFAVVVLYLTGCDPRRLPQFKQESNQQEERITKETEQGIANLPALRELNRVCAEEIPRPEGFVSVNKYGDLLGATYLGYGYHSTLDYEVVKTFYITYLTQHGWRLTKQKDGGWGQPQIEFRKDDLMVIVYDMGQGEGINYSMHCERLVGSPEVK